MGLLRPTTQPSLALIHPTCRSAGGGGGERWRAFFFTDRPFDTSFFESTCLLIINVQIDLSVSINNTYVDR